MDLLDGVSTVPARRRPIDESAGGAGLLVVLGLLLYLLVAAFHGSRQPAAAHQPTPNLMPAFSGGASSPTAHLVIIVVGADRATEVEALLRKEADLRQDLGEPLRDAEVMPVASEAEAEALAAAIAERDQLSVEPAIAAVVIR